MDGDKFSKLPELAKPSLYKIHLAPCLKSFKCPGETSIQLEVCCTAMGRINQRNITSPSDPQVNQLPHFARQRAEYTLCLSEA